MPRPGSIIHRDQEYLKFQGLPWLNSALGRGPVRGGIYFLSGEPGVGKSTLMAQALGDLALQGSKVLYMTNEQSLAEIEAMLRRLFIRKDSLPAAIRRNFFIEDRVGDVDELPRFLSRYVQPRGEEYHGIKAMAFDSIQGRGLSSSSSPKYGALYEFLEAAKSHGIATFVLGHVNKSGQIAGPRTLEHNVDCILYTRRAFRMRPLFVPKNRFGPAVLDPIPLVMDRDGRLAKSPQSSSRSSKALGYAGVGQEFAEVQAAVGLARYGSSPQLNAPSLPRPKMKQLLKVLSGLKGIDLSDLSYEVNVYIPENRGYSEVLDLPLAMTMLGSYLQLSVPQRTLFLGEIDLERRVRPPKEPLLERLIQMILETRRDDIEQIYLSGLVRDRFTETLFDRLAEDDYISVKVRGVRDLEDVIRHVWPTL